ncbi:DeoR/GlpR family DNA-binding transcription regulator [Alteromonas halophila]|uniref:XRE family transcriptional regulator n=1 Tax=Alteromonas halophila TaxID=516698 RepID=A0A918N0P5_9ALTE|nr:DeoR family transcriptional regulator [Alteromonas halophila]GGW90361.1 XRE family transcriptional regulator [Alteromonas halophila]
MKQSDTQQRRNAIVDWVNQHGTVQVETLAHHFGTSEVTIRKDLSLLANAQRLIRQFGGAAPLPGTPSVPTADKGKAYLGAAAAAVIGQRRKLVIDCGSTTQTLLPHLAALDNLMVMSNSLHVANVLTNNPNEPTFLMTGGTWDPHSDSFQGAMAENTVAAYSFDIAFIGASGIDVGRGTTTLNELTGLTRTMAASAKDVVVMAESKKLDERMPNLELAWSQITMLVTDDGITAKDKQRIEAQGVTVRVASRKGEN